MGLVEFFVFGFAILALWFAIYSIRLGIYIHKHKKVPPNSIETNLLGGNSTFIGMGVIIRGIIFGLVGSFALVAVASRLLDVLYK